jgi:protocatechuate 3,4-dioxygenase beta subunit
MLRQMRISRSPLIFAILTLTLIAAAQTRPQTAAQAEQKATLSGTVVKAGTGQPLKRARVSLRRQNQQQTQPALQQDQLAALNAVSEVVNNLAVAGLAGAAQQMDQRLMQANMVALTQAVTDDSGRFMFNGVEPGQYRISVDRDGYIRQEYGQRSFSGPGTIISINPGQRVSNLDIQMVTAGSLSGRVFNEDGEPLANVQVQAQTYTYQQGKRVLSSTGQSVPTNDLGEYRIYWLAPGDYYVSATARRGIVAAVNPVVTQQAVQPRPGARDGGRGPAQAGQGMPPPLPAPPQPARAAQNDETYAPTYFPGTITPETATPVRLAAAAEIRGIDFGLRPVQTVAVRGQVIVPTVSAQPAPAPRAGGGPGARGFGPGGRGGSQVNVTLTRAGNGARNIGNMNRTNVRPDGFFEITNVVPGSYNLAAVARQDGQQFSGRIRIEVGAAGLDTVSVPLRPGVAIQGKIFLDGTPPANFKPSQLRVNVQPAEDLGIGMGMGGGGNGQVSDDGSFTLQNVAPMDYRVRVGGLPQGAYLMAGRIGSDDAVNRPFTITGDQPVVLQLQIGFSAGRVQGTVVDEKGSSYQGVLATLVPEDSRRLRTDVYFSSPTDQYGRVSFANVPPGIYKLFAWEDIPSGAYQDPEYIQRFEDRGKVVKVDPGATAEVQVPVIRR